MLFSRGKIFVRPSLFINTLSARDFSLATTPVRHPLGCISGDITPSQMRMQFDTEKLALQPALGPLTYFLALPQVCAALCHGNAKSCMIQENGMLLSASTFGVIRSVMGVASRFQLRYATTPHGNYVNGRRYTRP